MSEINDLNIVDASNTTRFPELQAASSVNDGSRALEGLLARWHEDIGARISSTGSANAYAVAATQTITAYYDGLMVGFDANFANTGSATLNVDGVAAATIKKDGGASNLIANDIVIGQKVQVIYDGTNFQMVSPTPAPATPTFPATTKMLFQQTLAPTLWTKVLTDNNKAIRIVTGTVGSGGAAGFTTVFGAGKTTGGTAISIAQMPIHDHPATIKMGSEDLDSSGQPTRPQADSALAETSGSPRSDVVDVTNAGSGSTHNHTLSLDLQFIDAIWATKD